MLVFSPDWENDSCIRSSKHFCKNHKIHLCNIWLIALHSICDCRNDVDEQDIDECLQFVKGVLISIIRSKQMFKNENSNKKIVLTIKHFWDWISSIEEKVIDYCWKF